MDKETVVLRLVFEICKENPAIVSKIIDSATSGIKEFANNQRDKSSKFAAILTSVLDQHDNKSFGIFTRKEILAKLAPWFENTAWYNKQLEQLK